MGPILAIWPQKSSGVLARLRPPAQDTRASYDATVSDGCLYLSVTWRNETFIAVALGWISELCFPRDQAASFILLLQFTGSDPNGNNSHKRVT